MADNDIAVDIPQTVGTNTDPQLAYQNNNPGNIKFAGQPGAEQGTPAKDGGYFAKFPTAVDGYRHLRDVHIPKHANQTLSQYIGGYAPPKSNNTAQYIADASKSLGVTPETPVGQIDREKLAQFQAKVESSSKIRPTNAFDRADSAPEPNAFDRADAAPTVPSPSGVQQPVHQPVQGAWNPQHDTLENISDQMEDVFGQVGRNVGGMATGAAHLLLHPIDTIKNSFAKPGDPEFGVKDLPVVGPISEGRYGAGLGDLATLFMGGKAAEEGVEAARGINGEDAGAIRPTPPSTTIGEEPLPTLKQRLADLTPTSEEAAQRQAVKPLAEQFPGVKDPISAQAKYGKTIPEMQELAKQAGVKITKDNAGTIADTVKEKNIRILQHYQDAATESGNLIDGKAIAKDIRATKLNDPSPKAAAMNDSIEEEAKSYEKLFTIPQMMQLIKEKNQFSGSFYDMKPSDQYQAAFGKQVTDATLGAIRRETYQAMDPKSKGVIPQELQHRIGSAIEMRDSVYDRNSQAIKAKSNAPGVLPENAGDLGVLGIGGPKAYLAKKGIDILGHKIGSTPDSQFESVFKKYKGSYDTIPDPGPRSYKLNLSPDAPGEQRSLFGEGVTNPSNPNDWRSQSQDLPVHQLMLKGSEPEVPYPTQRPLYKEGIVNPAQPKLPYGPRPGDLGKPLTPPLRTRPGPAVGPVRSGLRWNGTHFVEDD